MNKILTYKKMNMKKISKILALSLLVAVFSSCSQDEFEIPQKGVLELESFYANADDDDAISAMMAIYKTIYTGLRGSNWYVSMNARTNDCVAGSDFADSDALQQFSNYNMVTTNTTVNSMYQSYYQIIYWCNLLIENVAAESNVKRQIIAEAKAIRAFCHFDLIRLWGTPVKVDRVLTAAEAAELTNTPAAETWALVEQDLNEAISGLPSKAGIGGQAVIGGRLTAEAAKFLLGKAQLYQGKNAEAAATLRQIITSGLYDLGPIADLYRPAADFGPEYLWEFNSADGTSNIAAQGDMREAFWGWRADNVDSDGAGLVRATWGFGAPTAIFANFLLSYDGGKSDRWKAYIADFEDILEMGSTGVWSPPVSNCEGYFRLLRVAREEDLYEHTYAWAASARSKANQAWIRYSEVLLLYAEAQLAANGDSDGSGLEALNKTRTRSGLSALGSYNMQELKDEKRAELFFEGERFFDLVRWGDCATELADKGRTWYSFYGYASGTTNWDVRSQPGPGTGWNDKYKLLPFPYNEMLANPNMVQNPGW